MAWLPFQKYSQDPKTAHPITGKFQTILCIKFTCFLHSNSGFLTFRTLKHPSVPHPIPLWSFKGSLFWTVILPPPLSHGSYTSLVYYKSLCMGALVYKTHRDSHFVLILPGVWRKILLWLWQCKSCRARAEVRTSFDEGAASRQLRTRQCVGKNSRHIIRAFSSSRQDILF